MDQKGLWNIRVGWSTSELTKLLNYINDPKFYPYSILKFLTLEFLEVNGLLIN